MGDSQIDDPIHAKLTKQYQETQNLTYVAYTAPASAAASNAPASAATPAVPTASSPVTQQTANPLATYGPMALSTALPLAMGAAKKGSAATVGAAATGGAGSMGTSAVTGNLTVTPTGNLALAPTTIPTLGTIPTPTSTPLSDIQLAKVQNGTVYYDPTSGNITAVKTPGTYEVNVTSQVDPAGNTVYSQTVTGQVTQTPPLANQTVNGIKHDSSGNMVPSKGTLTQDATFAGEAAGAAVAGNSLFSGVQNLMDHGITLGHLATAAASFLGLALALHLMHTALALGGIWIMIMPTPTGPVPVKMPISILPATAVVTNPTVHWYAGVGATLQALGVWLPKILYWLTSTEGIIAVGGLIVAAAIISDFLHGKPSDAQTAPAKLPVWTTGKVLTIASTAAFLNMGYNIDLSMPLTSQGIPIPITRLQSIFAQGSPSALTYADGNAYAGIPDDGSPIVIKGQNGQGDRVMTITKDGMYNDRVKMYDLGENLTFSAPTDVNGAYMPWVVNGKLNADAVSNSKHQSDLLAACQQGLLDAKSCANAVKLAASGNKSGVTADTSSNGP